MSVLTIILSIITGLFALGVVLFEKPLHSALSLVLTSFLIAVHYALLDAHFLAAIQVIIYTGAIMVLVVFVIMLLGLDANIRERVGSFSRISAASLVVSFLLVILWIFYAGGEWAMAPAGTPLVPLAQLGTTEAIGKALFTDHVFAFELTSVLLMVGIIGSVLLGLADKRPLPPGRGLKDTQAKSSEVSRAIDAQPRSGV